MLIWGTSHSHQYHHFNHLMTDFLLGFAWRFVFPYAKFCIYDTRNDAFFYFCSFCTVDSSFFFSLIANHKNPTYLDVIISVDDIRASDTTLRK